MVSRGKHLLIRVGDDSVHTHLKMEGAWHVYAPDAQWRRPAHQARIVLGTDDCVAVGFSLGITEILARDDEESAVGHLGPDLLGPDWDARRGDPQSARRPATARSASPCSTSATWPVSATCTATRSASSAASTPTLRRAAWPTCPRWSRSRIA